MPVGFNLFSFDLFEAFRRRRDEALAEGEPRDASASAALSEEDEDRRRRDEDAEKAHWWGLGYFPVL